MSTIGQNIKILRKEQKASQLQLAGAVGVKSGTISNYEKGISEPDLDKTTLISKFFGVSIDEMLNISVSEKPYIQHEAKEEIVKYYDIDASAGSIEMFDTGNGSTYKDLVIPGFSDCDIALNVWGDSMEPVLNKGEIILCKEWKESYIEYGHMYLIITKTNHRMIKYLQPSKDENMIRCESENDFYKPIEIRRNDILKLYVVKGHVERNVI